MNPPPNAAQDIEQSAATTLRLAATAARSLARTAVQDSRYDELAALAAAASATQATTYLPLPDHLPDEDQQEIDHDKLVNRLLEIADGLDELGRRATEPQQVQDHHMAALHSRDTAIALRNAPPIEEGSVG
ncbi:hypothetical protein [Kitasatospora brasiliensis]|uniref:hypothetical protein n=1 Tax=Kitasatospora brasiliensis TaxID=3058040 RepID=UPI002931B816|nr:hypothetical protein [Kitasatospora sp. K002]